MAFYRNNIGRAQQVIRVVLGAAVVVLGLVMLPAPWGWLAAAAGIGAGVPILCRHFTDRRDRLKRDFG